MSTTLDEKTVSVISERADFGLNVIARVHAVAQHFDWTTFSTLVPVESQQVATDFAWLCVAGTPTNAQLRNLLARQFREIDARLVRSPEELELRFLPGVIHERPSLVVILTRIPASPILPSPNSE